MYLLMTLRNKEILVKKANSFELCKTEMEKEMRDVENLWGAKQVKSSSDFAYYVDDNDNRFIVKIVHLIDETRSTNGYLVCEFYEKEFCRFHVCESEKSGRKLLYEFCHQIPSWEDFLEDGKAIYTGDYAFVDCRYHGRTILQSISMREIEQIGAIIVEREDIKQKIA